MSFHVLKNLSATSTCLTRPAATHFASAGHGKCPHNDRQSQPYGVQQRPQPQQRLCNFAHTVRRSSPKRLTIKLDLIVIYTQQNHSTHSLSKTLSKTLDYRQDVASYTFSLCAVPVENRTIQHHCHMYTCDRCVIVHERSDRLSLRESF